MQSRPAAGEVGLALVFAGLGLLWIVGAWKLPFWEGFAPQSGFLPFMYGVLLFGLSVLIAIGLFYGMAFPAEERQPLGKPLLVLTATAACVVGLEAAGFGIAVFLMLAFVFVVVERLNIALSAVVAAATTAFLILIFKTWLGVPLPVGPLGI